MVIKSQRNYQLGLDILWPVQADFIVKPGSFIYLQSSLETVVPTQVDLFQWNIETK